MPILRRISDGAGDQGSRVEAIRWNEDGSFKEVAGNRPIVGCSMLVGSVSARSYSSQDYWLTTPITEILEEQLDGDQLGYVKFKTGNSVYELYSESYRNKNKNGQDDTLTQGQELPPDQA